jgi:hypothetical protein
MFYLQVLYVIVIVILQLLTVQYKCKYVDEILSLCKYYLQVLYAIENVILKLRKKIENGTIYFCDNYQSHYEKQNCNSPFLSKVFYYISVQMSVTRWKVLFK